jgi:hypothetical protein
MKSETKNSRTRKQWALRKGILFENELYLLSDIFNWDKEGFSLKQKGKYLKDIVCFDQIITIKTKWRRCIL